MNRSVRCLFSIAVVLTLSAPVLAQRRPGGGGAGTRTSVNQNRNVNRNTNVNQNVNVNRNINVNRNVDIDVHGGYGYGGCCYHPIATAAAVTATAMVTAAVIGSMVHTLPPACSAVIVNGFTYQQCGNTWYQPQFAGTSTTYVVVNAPR